MSKRRLWSETQGVTSVEYAVLLSLVVVGGALLIWGVGSPMVLRFRTMQAVIGLPFP